MSKLIAEWEEAKTDAKINFESICWAFYAGSTEAESFKEQGLPVIDCPDEKCVRSLSWLLDLKDSLSWRTDGYPNDYYVLIAKVYKNKHLQAPAQSLLCLSKDDKDFNLVEAIQQLIYEYE